MPDTTGLSDLPDEVRSEIAPHMPPSDATLDAISNSISWKRDEAKASRASSGVETIWTEAEEAYIGMDEVNRSEFASARWAKPTSPDGPVTTSASRDSSDKRSTAFVRLTSRYVDAGAAKLAKILLPVDDKAFKFSETPVPELIKAKEDKSQVIHDGLNNAPLSRPLKPGEQPPPGGQIIPFPQQQPQQPSAPSGPMGPPGQPPALGGSLAPSAPPPAPGAPPVALPPGGAAGAPPMVPLTVKDLAEEAIEIARKKAKAAEERIYDWMVECRFRAEARNVIFDAARIGVGVFKGPTPKANRAVAVSKGADGRIGVQVKESIKPASKWVDPWNIFPDPSCGEDIHDGSYIFERDYMTESQVLDLKKLPGYIASQIDKVIELGPPTKKDENRSPSGQSEGQRKGRYEIWYFYGALKQEEYDCCRAAASGEITFRGDNPEVRVHAIVTMIGNIVVRATLNPLDSGSFPYRSMAWQRRSGSWAGIGVGEQLKMPQKSCNGATRATFNNAGISAGVQIILDQSSIQPADGEWSITPNKIWYKVGDSAGDDVRKVMQIIEIPNVTEQLMKIIEYAMKLAEEVTSIPLITQGQTAKTTPDTLGGMQLQDNNANDLLRDIGFRWDDCITEPMVNDYYEWLLLDPDVPDDEKGDFTIDAHGSIAMVEQVIQDQTIAQMGALVKDPAYGLDPRRWAKVWLKSKRIDPTSICYSEEELQRIDSQPPTPAPTVQVAQIAAQTAAQALVAKQSSDQRTDQNEAQIAQAAQTLESGRVQAENQRTATDATIALHELETKRQIAMLEHATKRGMSIAQLQVELAKLDTQKQISATDSMVELHKHHVLGAQPPMPPPNRGAQK
jgi:hypothetical protein